MTTEAPTGPAQPPVSYPVTIRGDLNEPVIGWLFLVKWLLLIPHFVVLFFLAIGFVFSWIFSLVAILFTGRYPRSLFDYNVGVMRWFWRIAFYSYGALGTDKYPPFTLEKRDDYPADLDVVYPERLSPGLVLIKWWLLAIPHYIVLGFLTGGFGPRRFSLQFALVFFAAVAKVFGRPYPADMWDFVMGINRWNYRVFAYAALMTDQYPPFNIRE